VLLTRLSDSRVSPGRPQGEVRHRVRALAVGRARTGWVLDEPRPGRPRTITDEQVEEVIVRTLEATPREATHCSTRSMAREVGLTQSEALRLWGRSGCSPPPVELQAVQGPPVHRQGPRRRRAVPEPARARSCCASIRSPRSRRWTAPRRSCRCRPAPPARQPPLKARRHLTPTRRVGHHHREGRRGAARPPPRDRVSEVPADHRPRSPGPPSTPPRPGQLLHPPGNGNGWPRAVAHCSRPKPAPALRASGVVDACGSQRASLVVRCGGSASDPVQGLIVERLP
jgi:hypothetical protein